MTMTKSAEDMANEFLETHPDLKAEIIGGGGGEKYAANNEDQLSALPHTEVQKLKENVDEERYDNFVERIKKAGSLEFTLNKFIDEIFKPLSSIESHQERNQIGRDINKLFGSVVVNYNDREAIKKKLSAAIVSKYADSDDKFRDFLQDIKQQSSNTNIKQYDNKPITFEDLPDEQKVYIFNSCKGKFYAHHRLVTTSPQVKAQIEHLLKVVDKLTTEELKELEEVQERIIGAGAYKQYWKYISDYTKADYLYERLSDKQLTFSGFLEQVKEQLSDVHPLKNFEKLKVIDVKSRDYVYHKPETNHSYDSDHKIDWKSYVYNRSGGKDHSERM